MNRFIAAGAPRITPLFANAQARSRMSIDLLVGGPPVKFECHEAEIPRIKKIIYDAGYFSPVDTNLRRQWGRSCTAIVECDTQWEVLVPILQVAGYVLGAA